MQTARRKGELCLPSKHAGGEQQGRCILGAVSHSIHCVLSGKGAEWEMRKLTLKLFYMLRSLVPAHSTPKDRKGVHVTQLHEGGDENSQEQLESSHTKQQE